MTVDEERRELEAVATDWLALWNVPIDWGRFDELHAEAFEDRASAGRPATREGFAGGLREMVTAFPDLRTTLDDLVVDTARARVAVRWTGSGTNRARYLGIGPTNRRTTITGIEIIEIASGRVVRRWGEWDVTDHEER